MSEDTWEEIRGQILLPPHNDWQQFKCSGLHIAFLAHDESRRIRVGRESFQPTRFHQTLIEHRLALPAGLQWQIAKSSSETIKVMEASYKIEIVTIDGRQCLKGKASLWALAEQARMGREIIVTGYAFGRQETLFDEPIRMKNHYGN